jgi:arginine decarboxylase
MADSDINQARETYNVAHWGAGYFDINEQGHLTARPRRDKDETGIDLYELTREIHAAGLSLPVLVRFTDILHDRVETLCDAFQDAMRDEGYEGGYTAVYPIKVNQQRSVVEELLSRGAGGVGLEAGSKPELMAVLALSSRSGGVIICNGYKDREYIRLALIGKQLGHRVYIVVEKLSELETVIREARELNISPLLGMRVRLASIGAGKWQNTGGEKAKFGLSAAQVLQMVERLRSAGMLDSLQLLHFHMGSQIANVRDIQRGMREAGRHYAELHSMGVNIRCVDVGGGLGVDYEGTRSRSFCSMNYSVQEYARNIVHSLWETCSDSGLPYPDIITESGRAMTAHHAVLITNVIDIERAPDTDDIREPSEDDPIILQDLWQGLQSLSSRSVLEVYHDAVYWLAEARAMYNHGVLNLEQRARAEQLYFATCHQVRPLLQASSRAHRELLDELNDILADKYFCNFSVFQSIPDVWAIKQLFPIVPLHRLQEPPSRHAVLQDLTCDSDGRIDQYIDQRGVESTLPLHQLRGDEPYLLGIFMVGAYQEILGDLHNLFGDTDSVNIALQADGEYRLAQPERGDTVEDVLRYVHFNAADLLQAYQRKIAEAGLSESRCRQYLEELEAGLGGYTYLED